MDIQIHINSILDRQQADQDFHTWTTFLRTPIRVKTKKKIRVIVESIELPSIFYTFPYHSSIFYWLHDITGTPTVRSLELDIDKVYTNGTDVATDLNTKAAALGYNVNFSYSSSEYKLTITNNESVSIRPISSYRFQEPYTTPDDCMDRTGFNQNYTSLVIPPTGSLKASGILRLLPSNCYYLRLEQLGNYLKQSIVPNNTQTNILTRISASSFGNLSELNFPSSTYLTIDKNESIDFLQFTLLDDELQPVLYNNGVAITFTLKISFFDV
jgi:hypothetical protein